MMVIVVNNVPPRLRGRRFAPASTSGAIRPACEIESGSRSALGSETATP